MAVRCPALWLLPWLLLAVLAGCGGLAPAPAATAESQVDEQAVAANATLSAALAGSPASATEVAATLPWTVTPAPTSTPPPAPATPDAGATQTAQVQQLASAVAATLAVQAAAEAIAATLTAQATSTPQPASTPPPAATVRPTPMPAALLAYVYGDVGAADIHVYDRASARTWTVASRACDEAEPDWLPDGRSVVYQADCDGGYDLYQVDVETRAVRRLTATPGENEREPDVSPDGGWLVYRTNREANARNLDGALHLINLGGGAPQPLGVAGRSPTWSPDGTQLLFMSERESNWEIYVYSLVDHSTRRLTNCDANCRFPTWSPDGQWVAYHSTTGPDTADAETIWRIPAGGGESALLVTGSGAGRPTWSVGGWIAFNSQQGIELVDERGEQRRILLASSSHWAPAWSR